MSFLNAANKEIVTDNRTEILNKEKKSIEILLNKGQTLKFISDQLNKYFDKDLEVREVYNPKSKKRENIKEQFTTSIIAKFAEKNGMRVIQRRIPGK